ncbi:6-phosphogluconolactonase [uncultured Cohaesibacter sp.]|uniref:6-phosphogluconolactonase n=1 Tax=uncultured Cohaesibacter sp. TaxID=1002546 RepID=UPI002AA8B3F2|nr:6-phosphogluconolactonase [uncultured Cohaesibacter sp.]
MTETRVYPDRGSLAAGLAEQVASELNKAIRKRGRATLAVPGGETPGAFLKELSLQEVEWECVSVILTDEHFVPETSDLSNGYQVRKLLLQNLAAQAQFYPFYHEVSEPEEALPLIATDLHEVLPIDVCVLAMGTDTRVAALFPNVDNLEEALGLWAPSVMVVRGHEDGEPRVTLTAPVLERARKAHILIVGEEKKGTLREAQKVGLVEEAPVRVILNRARATSIHYAD